MRKLVAWMAGAQIGFLAFPAARAQIILREPPKIPFSGLIRPSGASTNAAPAVDPALIHQASDEFLAATNRPVREAAVRKLLGWGTAGAAALLEALDDWSVQAPPLDDRQRRLSRGPSSQATPGALNPREEILRKQKAVQALRDDPDLTKEEIIKVGDPAMADIAAMLRAAARAEREAERGVAAEFARYRTSAAALLPGRSPAPAAHRLKDGDADEAPALYRRAKALSVQEWNESRGAGVPKDEMAAIEDANRIRMLAGLQPLKVDPLLCLAARGHSEDMARLKFFDHTSPVPGKTTPFDRARKAGTLAGGENIFMGSSSGTEANQGWFHSPGHHKNLMSPGYESIGMGRFGEYWTQMFR